MTRSRHEIRGWSLVVAIVALMAMLLLGMALLTATTAGLKEADRKHKESQALGLAEAGVEHMLWRLYQGSTELPTTVVLTELGGTVTTIARPFPDANGQPVPECVLIDSAGETQGWTTAVRVGARYLSTTAVHNPVFNYALFSDNDLTLSGDVSFDYNIHSNGSLRLNGGAAIDGTVESAGNMRLNGTNTITGDVRYGGSYRNTGGTSIGGQIVASADQHPMPTIDLAYYRSLAVQTYAGDHTFAGDTILPDGVIYVDGDLHLSGQVTGTGVLVVDGDVIITGNVSYGSEASELAILSTGQVRISGGAQVHGIIYAHNVQSTASWVGTGGVTVHGAVIADTISCSGGLTLRYHEPGNLILPGDSASPTQIAVFSWEKIT